MSAYHCSVSRLFIGWHCHPHVPMGAPDLYGPRGTEIRLDDSWPFDQRLTAPRRVWIPYSPDQPCAEYEPDELSLVKRGRDG